MVDVVLGRQRVDPGKVDRLIRSCVILFVQMTRFARHFETCGIAVRDALSRVSLRYDERTASEASGE